MDAPQENSPAPGPSLRRPAKLWFVATGVLVFCMYLVIQDLATSNRPHELHNAPWVAVITLLNLVPCTGVFRGLVRYSRACGGAAKRGLGFYAMVLGLVLVEGMNILLLASAASAVPAVLRG